MSMEVGKGRAAAAAAIAGDSEDRFLIISTTLLNQMRQLQQCTDVLLQTTDVAFPVHSIVLAACSEYFRNLFMSSECTAQGGTRVVQLPFLDGDTLALLLDFVYTGRLQLPHFVEDLRPLLLGSQKLQFADVPRHLSARLQHVMSPTNYSGLWMIADEFDKPEIRNVVLNYVVANFDSLCHEKPFQLLPAHRVKLVYPLLQPVLDDGTQNAVMSSILEWVSADPQNREKEMAFLLRFIKVAKLSPDYVADLVKNEPLVRRVDRVWRRLQSTLSLLKQPLQTQVKFEDVATILKAELGTPHSMLSKSLECHSLKSNPESVDWIRKSRRNTGSRVRRTKAAATLNCSRPIHLVSQPVVTHKASSGSKIPMPGHMKQKASGTFIVILGRDRIGAPQAHFFGLEELVWFSPETLSASLSKINYTLPEGATWAVHANILYLAGGFGSYGSGTRTVVAFDVISCTFCKMAEMIVARSSAGSVVMENYIYVLGGTSMKNKVVAQVERYDPARDMWRHVHPMPAPLSEMGTAVLKGLIYCIGGRSLGECPLDCYSYNPNSNQWTSVAPLPDSFCGTPGLATAMNDQRIYAVRYFNTSSVGSVGEYDPETQNWSLARCSGFPPRKVMVLLPRKPFVFAVDYSGKIYAFNTRSECWEREFSSVRIMAEPMYAAILVRPALPPLEMAPENDDDDGGEQSTGGDAESAKNDKAISFY